MIAKIFPITKIVGKNDSFDYLIPAEFEPFIKSGALVSIPFGNRKIRGIVEKIVTDESENTFKLKSILGANKEFVLPSKYLDIARWVADYYLCSLGDTIGMFLPPETIKTRKQKSENSTQEKELHEIKLSDDQEDIFQSISKTFKERNSKPVLIHGVTGSGKTEIYIKLIEQAINQGKQAIVLVPEIMLAPQTVERLTKYFGDRVLLLHSGLSKGEKSSSFFQFYQNEKPIIIGPRSALLVPTENIGLIVIDEEQEDSYKQEQTPRYHAVDLAKKIAETIGANLVMGTATPRIETYHETVNQKSCYYRLAERHGEAKIPQSKIIDLRMEMKAKNYSPLSLRLQADIKTTLEKKKQVLLFLNRRGLSTFVSCRDCGHIVMCDNCQIPMVCHIYDKQGVLSCHHCDAKKPLPAICPECGSPRIKHFGAGADRIEQEVNLLFPEARTLLVTADTIKSKKDYAEIYQKIKKHEVDIVIGTQMIAKGLDIPNVDLVGIVSADTGLHLPQYRSAERTFQLITQVSGRAGRRNDQGEVIVQSYWPESLAIVAATLNNYELFYDAEILEREKYNYPPFCKLIRIVASSENEAKAHLEIEKISVYLRELKIGFIGPAKCFFARINKKYRYHIIIKDDKINSRKDWSFLTKEFPTATLDVDPTDLL
ncbi:MAG: primosomal protein N' [Candidatus Berkelbacteria bacterium]